MDISSEIRFNVKVIKQWLQLSRVYNARSMILFFLLGQSLVQGSFRWQWNYFVVSVVFILVYAVISLWNYVVDVRVDALNQQENLIQKKMVSVDQVMRVSYSLVVACGLVSLFARNFLVIGSGIILLLVLGWLYSMWRWSYNPWGKILIMIGCYALIPGMMGLLDGGWDLHLRSVLVLVGLSLFYGSWLLYSDVKDIQGDREVEKRTFAVVLGVERMSLVCVVLSLISLLLLLLLGIKFTILISGMALLVVFQILIWKMPTLLQIVWLRRGVGYLLLGFLFLAVLETW